VAAQFLVVTLLNPQIPGSGWPINDLPPRQDAAPVAQEVDDKDQGVTVWLYGTVSEQLPARCHRPISHAPSKGLPSRSACAKENEPQSARWGSEACPAPSAVRGSRRALATLLQAAASPSISRTASAGGVCYWRKRPPDSTVADRPGAAIDVLASNRSLLRSFSEFIGVRNHLAVTSGAPFPGARL